jgi:hypothetical protein
MYKLITIIFFIFLLCVPYLNSEPIILNYSFSDTEIFIGDTVKLSIKLKSDDIKYDINSGKYHILNKQKNKNNITIIFSYYESGIYKSPDIIIKSNKNIETLNPTDILVKKVQINKINEKSIQPLKLDNKFGLLTFIIIVIIIVIIIFVIQLLKKHKTRNPAYFQDNTQDFNIKKLKHYINNINETNFKKYIFDIDIEFRKYLTNKYNFNFINSTANKICENIEFINVNNKTDLMKYMKKINEIKFSDYIYNKTEIRDLVKIINNEISGKPN